MSGYSEGGASLLKKTLVTYIPGHFSAKSDIDANLPTLRARAADLAINSPVGASAIKTALAGTVATGLKVFPRLKTKELGLTPEQGRAWAHKTKLEFEMWAGSLDADFYRRNNFYEMQQIGFSSYLMDGDCFCLFRRRAGNPYTLKLQLIEAQRVSNPLTKGGVQQGVEMRGKTKGSRIVGGIEVNRDGRIEAVHISNRLWNEPSVNPELYWQRVKWFAENGERNVLHICKDSRVGQFRGEPFLAPVIETLKQISRYADAELMSAVMKSFFALFFTQSDSSESIDQILGTNPADLVDSSNPKPCMDVSGIKVESGMMQALPRGVSVQAVDNSSAQSTFDAFTNSFIMQIGAALGLPGELISKSFKNSYSASRAAMLQAADEFRIRREAFVNDFCQPVYEQFLIEAIARGRISAPGFFEDPLKRLLWSKADWYVEGNHLLDVTKEMEGARMRIELGISNRQKEAMELCGVDFYENLEQLQEEIEQLGLRNA